LLFVLPAAVYTTDRQGRITLFNDQAAELWGRRPEIGKEMWCGSWQIFKPDGTPLPHSQCPMAVALREGRSILGQEILVERPDGTRTCVLAHPQPLHDASGMIVGAVNMLVDITERKQVEEALRASEARFRYLADAIPQMVWMTRPDGQTEYVNRRWLAYTGLSLDEINDRSKLAQVIHPEDRLAVFEHYDQALQKGSIYQQEFRLKRAADGEYRWFLARSVPLRDERERIVRWFGTCTNIDEQKRAEETLQEADRRKDKFIAMLSHELRNPLAPIRNALHLLHLNPT